MAKATDIRGRSFGEDGELYAPSIERDGGPVPTQYRLPDWREIAGLDEDEKRALLQRYGIELSWSEYADLQAEWLARVSTIPPGSDRWQMEVNNLVDTKQGDVLDRMCRRAYENYTTALAVDGDPRQELIRISEADDAVCEVCEELSGEIGTLAYHTGLGLPGAASCLGGDRCRCTLVAID